MEVRDNEIFHTGPPCLRHTKAQKWSMDVIIWVTRSSGTLSQCSFVFAAFTALENRLLSVTHLPRVVGNPWEKPI